MAISLILAAAVVLFYFFVPFFTQILTLLYIATALILFVLNRKKTNNKKEENSKHTLKKELIIKKAVLYMFGNALLMPINFALLLVIAAKPFIALIANIIDSTTKTLSNALKKNNDNNANKKESLRKNTNTSRYLAITFALAMTAMMSSTIFFLSATIALTVIIFFIRISKIIIAESEDQHKDNANQKENSKHSMLLTINNVLCSIVLTINNALNNLKTFVTNLFLPNKSKINSSENNFTRNTIFLIKIAIPDKTNIQEEKENGNNNDKVSERIEVNKERYNDKREKISNPKSVIP